MRDLVTEDEWYDFEERCAIMEFDGGLSRYEAETAARRERKIKKQPSLFAKDELIKKSA